MALGLERVRLLALREPSGAGQRVERLRWGGSILWPKPALSAANFWGRLSVPCWDEKEAESRAVTQPS